MAKNIVRSVGEWARGAFNQRDDVKVVQELLKDASTTLKSPKLDPGKIDGTINRPPLRSGTVAAIKAFQATFMRHPDGLVEPGGKTIRALQALGGPAALPPPPPPPAPSPPPPVAAGLTTIDFPGTRVALVVRGKTGPAHHPGVMEQHADCILPNGAPVGFFGDMPGGSSGPSVGMNLDGVVADYTWFLAHRVAYVDRAQAKKYGMVSTVLTVDVSAKEAAAFAGYWSALKLSPGRFYILGNNCSTHASDAFVTAGILPSGIPGLDTPDNLYTQLATVKASATKSYSGFVGFTPGGAGYVVEVE